MTLLALGQGEIAEITCQEWACCTRCTCTRILTPPRPPAGLASCRVSISLRLFVLEKTVTYPCSDSGLPNTQQTREELLCCRKGRETSVTYGIAIGETPGDFWWVFGAYESRRGAGMGLYPASAKTKQSLGLSMHHPKHKFIGFGARIKQVCLRGWHLLGEKTADLG